MPYKKSATIYFINTSNVPVQVEANVNVEALQWTNTPCIFIPVGNMKQTSKTGSGITM